MQVRYRQKSDLIWLSCVSYCIQVIIINFKWNLKKVCSIYLHEQTHTAGVLDSEFFFWTCSQYNLTRVSVIIAVMKVTNFSM